MCYVVDLGVCWVLGKYTGDGEKYTQILKAYTEHAIYMCCRLGKLSQGG